MALTKEIEIRKEVLECAKEFKTSWINLGRFLYSVFNEKLFREWGYQEFETYCAKEIGIKAQTAQKLLRSYYFLEREEPTYVKKDRFQGEDSPRIPDYEAVNVLRLAKNQKLDEENYDDLKRQVLEEGKPVQTVRRQYRQILDDRNEKSEEEIEADRRKTMLKRYLSILKSLQKELLDNEILGKKTLAKMDNFVKELEEELKSEIA